MSDYYSANHLARKLGLTSEELEQAQRLGLIQPVQKNGFTYYSAQHAYRLRAACQLRRKHQWSWEQVLAELSKRPLYQVSSR